MAKKNILLPMLVAGLLLAGGLWPLAPAAAEPAPAAPAPEVGVVTLAPQRVVLTSELAGRTAPYLIAEVRPQVGGIIQQRRFKEGAEVKAGEALYQIDPATYRAALASADAALAKAEANLVAARLRAERYRELVASDAVSRQDCDDARAAMKQAEAEVASCRAAQRLAGINLGYTRVTAPIAGRIGRSAVTAGALVTANQAASLATIQQLDPIYVDVTQSSGELLRLKRDLASGRLKSAGEARARVRLLLEDGTTYGQEGVLEFSEVTVDQTTGAVTLRAVLPNPARELLPGMYVRALLETGVDEKALLVPQRGVTRNQRGEAVVLVVGEGERVSQRVIVAERALGDQWLATSGLQPGERVVIEGLQRVRPGSVVRAVPFVPAAGGR